MAHKLEKIFEILERLEDKPRRLHLMKQPPSHERVISTSLLGHTRVMHDLTNDLAKFVHGEFVVCLDDGDYWKLSKKTRHLSYTRTRPEDLDNLVGFDEVQNPRTILLVSKFFIWQT
jgi:hypothetical protein